MVIDSSALIAILRNEPEAATFENAIFRYPVRLVSAVTKLESGMVAAGRRGAVGATDLDRLLAWISATIVPFDERQADIARDAFIRYGKGRHSAGLNFGDCAAYALAIAEAEPLLFKGTDFAATDVECVRLGEAAEE
jgi:ribonuclease VapC